MEAPEPFTGFRVVGVDEAAAGRVSAGDAHDDLVAHDKRRLLGILVLLHLAYLDVPADASGLRIERHEVGVQGSHVHCPADDRHTPIRRPAAKAQLLRKPPLVMPQLGAGPRVDGEHVIPGGGQIDHAVDKQRRRLQAIRDAGLEAPHRHQALDVVPVDLRERAEAVARVVAAPHEPVVRVPLGVEQAFRPQVLHDCPPGLFVQPVDEGGHGRAPDPLPDDPVQLGVRNARLPCWIGKIRGGSPISERPMAHRAVFGE